MKDTRKRKTKKGDFGYFNSEKKRRLLITAGLFSLPLLIFFVALGRQRHKNDSLDGSDRSRLSARM